VCVQVDRWEAIGVWLKCPVGVTQGAGKYVDDSQFICTSWELSWHFLRKIMLLKMFMGFTNSSIQGFFNVK